MADRPHFESREDYIAWRNSRGGAGTATLDPPEQGYQGEPLPAGEATPVRPRPAMPRGPLPTMVEQESGRVYEIIAALVLVAIVVAIGVWWLGANDSSLDPRCRIDADPRLRSRIAQFVNGSDLMQSYMDTAGIGSQQVVALGLEAERNRIKSRGGDYDPGNVRVVFSVQNLKTGKLIYERDMKVALDAFMVGRFDKDASRDEIQEIAFNDAEEKVMPYLDRWVDLAAMRAMGQEGRYGTAFVKDLKGVTDDKWSSEELHVEAMTALNLIEGTS